MTREHFSSEDQITILMCQQMITANKETYRSPASKQWAPWGFHFHTNPSLDLGYVNQSKVGLKKENQAYKLILQNDKLLEVRQHDPANNKSTMPKKHCSRSLHVWGTSSDRFLWWSGPNSCLKVFPVDSVKSWLHVQHRWPERLPVAQRRKFPCR